MLRLCGVKFPIESLRIFATKAAPFLGATDRAVLEAVRACSVSFLFALRQGWRERNMITRKIGEGGRWLLEKIVDVIAATGINPNVLTFFGLLVNCWAAFLFADWKIPLRRHGHFLRRVSGHAGWTSGAAGKTRHGIRRFFRFHAGPLLGHGAVHGLAGVLRRGASGPPMSFFRRLRRPDR